MTLAEFAKQSDLTAATQVERAATLAYYHLVTANKTESSLEEIKAWFLSLHFRLPNTTRLVGDMLKNGFTRGLARDSFRLEATKIKQLEKQYSATLQGPQEVKSDGSVLPDSLLLNKRGYIQRFGKQVNACYSQGISDGCAVLMRRMVEICLIHTYENYSLLNTIQVAPGQYKELKAIIDDAVANPALALTKDAITCLDDFRVLGNLSAHKLYYSCRPEEIAKVRLKFRLLIEELFNKAGKTVEA